MLEFFPSKNRKKKLIKITLSVVDNYRLTRIELTPISLASSLTNASLTCLRVAIHTSPLLTLWPHSFSYKIE